jgi:O-antigen/teichoic acid export membrane protein
MLSNMFQLAGSALVSLYISKLIGSYGTGAIAFAQSSVNVLNSFLEFRLQDLGPQIIKKTDVGFGISKDSVRDLLNLFKIDLLAKIAIGSVSVFYAACPTSASFGAANLRAIVIITALTYLFSKTGSGLCSGVLRCLGRSDICAYLSVAETILKGLAIIFVALNTNAQAEEICWMYLGVGCVSNLINVFLAYRECSKYAFFSAANKLSVSSTFFKWRDMLSANALISVTDLVLKESDILIMSIFLRMEEIGVYKMAKTVIMVTWKIIDPVSLSFLPEVQAIVEEQTFLSLVKYLFKIGACLFVVTAAISFSVYIAYICLLKSFLGPQFDSLIYLVPIMLIGVVISAVFVWAPAFAAGIGKPRITLFGSIYGSLFGLPIILIGSKFFGVTGAAIGWTITLFVTMLVTAIKTLTAIKNLKTQHPEY